MKITAKDVVKVFKTHPEWYPIQGELSNGYGGYCGVGALEEHQQLNQSKLTAYDDVHTDGFVSGFDGGSDLPPDWLDEYETDRWHAGYAEGAKAWQALNKD